MNGKFKGFKITGAILILLGLIFISIGFGKKNNYSNGTYSSKNAYVGGDAYNYIINSGYFAGYVTLGGLTSLGGIVLYSTATLGISRADEYKSLITKLSDTENETSASSPN